MEQRISSFDPSNGERLGEVVKTSRQELDMIVDRARQAGADWQKTPMVERVRLLQAAYASAESRIPELAELLSKEMGKDIRRSTGEVQGTVLGAPYIADSAMKALQSTSEGATTIEYKPLGIAAIISPWNYPLAMANNLIVPALVAGNSVIWKPSEETPLIAQALFDLISPSLPDNLLHIIHGDREIGRMLVESDVQIIGFTGSQATGKDIMKRAADKLKRLVMELGGNDPMIVLKDCDLPSAAGFAVASSFENAGQMCTSTERIYVDESIAEQFEQLVVSYAAHYKVGPWNGLDVNIGPIINQRQHSRIIDHIRDAEEKGATLLMGGTTQPERYILPTVITGMNPGMLIEQEETFGPLVCISRFSDPEDAVNRANDSSYGLGGVVFGGPGARDVADRLEAGMIGVNRGVGGEGNSPWVGAKQSGFGFHGSPEGHRQFAQVRVIGGR